MPEPAILSVAPRPRPLGSIGKRNVFANWTAFLYGAVAFAMSPFVVHSLGDTGYGIWVLLTALVNYLGH